MRVIGGEGYASLRTGSIVERSLLPIQSFYEPKVALKKKKNVSVFYSFLKGGSVMHFLY